MSHAGTILGISEPEVKRVDRDDPIRVYARPTKRKLPGFPALIEQLRASPLHKLASTLSSWLEAIIAMWRFTRSNGITEGFHIKMEMMTRRAFGFRNFENYRLRVLTHCGWDGMINRV